jgi:hypothetical protein
VYWPLQLTVVDRHEHVLKQQEVIIRDDNKEVFRGKTDEKGELTTELSQYVFRNGEKVTGNRYTVAVGAEKRELIINGSTVFRFKLKKPSIKKTFDIR